MSLSIASINIERSRHLARVAAFIERERPRLLCLQELCERDIPFFEALMGGTMAFAPMARYPEEGPVNVVGVGMLVSGEALLDVKAEYYSGNPAHIQEMAFVTLEGKRMADPLSIAEVMLSATVSGFRVAVTHLNVTPFGTSTPYQRESAGKLIALAQAQSRDAGGLLLTGDFNAPRGRATFDLIAEHFIDGVPAHYTSSIDGALHRAGEIPFMVDGLFHTPGYRLENARLTTGVSDHCALSCRLSKA
ncbi:endonuclease/exonuclease/phosphatase family protein [Pseudomonas sp. GD03944]|uniref:endonuclease/exonuclease/phosphatase family protein n=1 Tax=Pseudomonas sp. GD03944 TaxID=2975409 RepID=UPI00244B4A58|nr:endonuclease/exonuclease/phosphatase family protein [Pseudomonas sp. GD03944]MDH1263888.1 endonuclease/exonuclease/phosphatase family protein [Pseudomonas sp. GD03944]